MPLFVRVCAPSRGWPGAAVVNGCRLWLLVNRNQLEEPALCVVKKRSDEIGRHTRLPKRCDWSTNCAQVYPRAVAGMLPHRPGETPAFSLLQQRTCTMDAPACSNSASDTAAISLRSRPVFILGYSWGSPTAGQRLLQPKVHTPEERVSRRRVKKHPRAHSAACSVQVQVWNTNTD